MNRSYKNARPKRNLVYSVADLLVLYKIGRNTLTNWIKSGLRPVDDKRPQLFRGTELIRFHVDRALSTRCELRSSEFMCMVCKSRVVPDIGAVEINVTKNGKYLASARCPDCGAVVMRLLSVSTCDAYKTCIKTNTSLHSLHEEKEPLPAGIGTNPPISLVDWNAENERILHDYRIFCGKDAAHTQDARFASIRDFEAFVGTLSFRLVKPKHADRYRNELARRGQKTSSRSSITHRASHLAQFFDWLVKQEGYRQMNHSLAGYFQLSRNDRALAIQPKARSVPTIMELDQIVRAMPANTLMQRRDRAIVATSCVFGTRVDATASLLVVDVELESRQLRQDATHVRVKNRKSQITVCFPIGGVFWHVLEDWIEELRALGLKDDDALFPPDADLLGFRAFMLENRAPIAPWSTDEGVRRAFRRGSKAAELPYANPHSIRHALAEFGRQVFRSVDEEMAWSHNLGHESPQTTRNHYAKMTDDHRDEIFTTLGRRDPTPEEEKDLLLRYHAHELNPGTPEFEQAHRLWQGRLARRKAV